MDKDVFMTPEEAYLFAKNNPGCDIEKYQEIACQNHGWAYNFSINIPEADIEYCYKYCNSNHRTQVQKFILLDDF